MNKWSVMSRRLPKDRRLPKRRPPGQSSLLMFDSFSAAKRVDTRSDNQSSDEEQCVLVPSGAADTEPTCFLSVDRPTESEVTASSSNDIDNDNTETERIVGDTSLVDTKAPKIPVNSDAVCSFDDVGKILEQEDFQLSDSDKLRLVNEHFIPGESYAFPRVFMNGHKRSFRSSWLKTYP